MLIVRNNNYCQSHDTRYRCTKSCCVIIRKWTANFDVLLLGPHNVSKSVLLDVGLAVTTTIRNY